MLNIIIVKSWPKANIEDTKSLLRIFTAFCQIVFQFTAKIFSLQMLHKADVEEDIFKLNN